MSHHELLSINWAQNGSVVISNGRIFVSPNSIRRDVILPAEPPSLTSPFYNHQERNLKAQDFDQPVWWSSSWGWIGFMPLSPSFLSHPFRSLCWKPKIEETDVQTRAGLYEKRFKITSDDAVAWKAAEDNILQACHAIRLAYKIPGETPPPPSDLGYSHTLKSLSAVSSRARTSRDWFVVWMGLLSYLICMSQHPHHNRERKAKDSVAPWYTCLRKDGADHSWLEGLNNSVVCDFDRTVPRNGIILRMSKSDAEYASIDWFLKHNIPVWFLFDAKEEQWLQNHRHFRNLIPPQSMINEALNELFRDSTPEVKGVIMVHYLNSELNAIGSQIQKMLRVHDLNTSTFQYFCNAIGDDDLARLPSMVTAEGRESTIAMLQAAVARCEVQARLKRSRSCYPWPQMLDRGDFQGEQLYEHWTHFFSSQKKRQVELDRCETVQERSRRLARERNPSKKRAVVYRWKKVVTGGKSLYARIRINRRNQEDVLHSFFKKPAFTRRFNAYPETPEWDLYEHFDDVNDTRPALETDDSDVSGSEDDQSPEDLWNEVYGTPHSPERSTVGPENVIASSPYRHMDSSQPAPPGDMVVTTDFHALEVQTCFVQTSCNSDPDTTEGISYIDIVQHMASTYGYTPVLDATHHTNGDMSWEVAMKLVGFPNASGFLVSSNDKVAITRFISQLMKAIPVDPDLDDLNPSNRLYLAGIHDLSKFFVRVDCNLFVFVHTHSSSVDWLLGVKGATAALLVMRLLCQNRNHTSLTLSKVLMDRGVAFHTLLRVPPTSSKPRLHFLPRSEGFLYLNPHNRVYTQDDYEAYKLSAERLLSRPFGRAALLKGGLIARIARQYLTFDAIANGPSSEVRVHHEGQIFSSERPGLVYMDDDLSDYEVQLLIGTYRMETAQANQLKLVSWLPPLTAWYESRNKNDWTQWTEVDEELFLLVITEIEQGLQPKSRNDWRSWIRAKRTIRIANIYKFVDGVTERNEAFMKSIASQHSMSLSS
ncbi:hypothetical protein BJ165DRAFT_1408076 [Panaeolus papilionaceus]|nr:hypothetical protein BJ165DRAFT_1408076 [Panaeolus papilionaceus]